MPYRSIVAFSLIELPEVSGARRQAFTLIELPAMRKGFTLIELLVVVTIVVVLMAMLTPALDKAVYQAELLRCSGNLKVVGTSMPLYAMANKRRYPDRGLPERSFGETGKQADPYLTPKQLARPLYQFDMRPPIRGTLNINANTRCPFTQPVELDQTGPEVAVECSYTTWWSWRYETTAGAFKGMYKLGDRWSFLDRGVTTEYNILAGDFDCYFPSEGVQGSHPDLLGLMSSYAVEGAPGTGELWNGTRWQVVDSNAAPVRGPIDMNHAFDDGSVRRYSDVVGQHLGGDDRMGRVPLQIFDQQQAKRFQVPRS